MVYLSPFFVMRHFSNITYKLMITDEGKNNVLHWLYSQYSLSMLYSCKITHKNNSCIMQNILYIFSKRKIIIKVAPLFIRMTTKIRCMLF